MSLEVHISNPEDSTLGKVHKPSQETLKDYPGVISYTTPLLSGRPLIKFFTDSSGSSDQNINSGSVGTSEGIYNGTDDVLWTATILSGSGFAPASTIQANSGAKSFYINFGVHGDTVSFTKGSNLAIASYTSLRGYIYITDWRNNNSKGIMFTFFDDSASVSDTINLEDYIDQTSQDNWQFFEIPLADFNLTSSDVDELQFSLRDVGGGPVPKGFLDDIELAGTASGGATDFTAQPDKGEVWDVTSIRITSAATKTTLDYDDFLGNSSLTNGYLLTLFQDSIASNYNFLDTVGFLQQPNTNIYFENGLYAVDFKFEKGSLLLDSKKGDYVNIRVRDDLSSVLNLKASIFGEIRGIV